MLGQAPLPIQQNRAGPKKKRYLMEKFSIGKHSLVKIKMHHTRSGLIKLDEKRSKIIVWVFSFSFDLFYLDFCGIKMSALL